MKKQFYEKALPSQGVYCAVGIKDGKPRQRFAETLDDLITATDELKEGGYNVYVAPNSFDGFTRKGDHAAYSRSFFVDLDVNERGYGDKMEATQALLQFIDDNELPPSVVVDSGTGIQAYWLFEDDVPVREWKPYAEKFKDFCIGHGLRIDPTVTADVARIMRCPETFNHKTSPPNPTRILTEEIYQYDFASFRDFLGVIEIPPDIRSMLALAPKVNTEDAFIYDDNFEYEFSDIVIKSLNNQACNQIKYIIENAATLSEPMWYAGLSVAVRCVDGAEAIHMMSEDYPGYSAEYTNKKAQQSLQNAKWAHGCKAFEKENPRGCDGCPFKGKLRSGSPIDFGRKFTAAPSEEEVSASDTVRGETDTETVPAFPKDLMPFVRGKMGGVFYMPPANDDGERDDPVMLTSNDLYPIKRMFAKSDGMCLLMRHVLPKDPVAEFIMPLKYIAAFDKLKQVMFENGVKFHVSQVQRMFEYLSKWDDHLQRKETAEIMRMQMGWTETYDAFVLGDIEITKTGEEKPTAASPMIRNIAKLVRRQGSYDIWKESANALNAPGFELHALGLFQGFGSPLMYLTSTPGASICYQSTDSGVGKTGALYAGLSVFCDPYNISLLEGAATDNAHIGRYLALKNLLFGIDEASNIEPETLSKMLHRISQGKAKLRMQASVNAERDLEMSASMQGAFSSNQSLYDKLFTLKTSPQGELARLIEFPMKKPKALEEDPTLGHRIFDPFRTNFGWAGPDYIKYLFKVGEGYIRSKINYWVERFSRDYGNATEYRFYMNEIAADFAGAELAVEAGIIRHDYDQIYRVVILAMIQIRDKTVKPANIDYKSLVSEFYYKNLQNFLIFNEDDRVMEYRGNSLIGRIEASTQRVYINKAEFKKFLAEKQVSTREFELVLEREKLLIGTEKKRLSSGWKAGTGATPPINVYVFASILDALDVTVNEG
jgi:hypothetical protein